MNISYRNLLPAVAGIALLVGSAAPAMADMGAMQGQKAAPVQQAHMKGRQGMQGGPGYGAQGMPCPMMNQGMMGQGHGRGMMMQPGYGGQMMNPGMMGPGQGMMMGPGMMGQGRGMGMMGQGPGTMMQPGYGGQMMGPGMMGPGSGVQAPGDLNLSAEDVRNRLEAMIAWHGNENLKVGEVQEADENTITGDIVTQDGSLVRRFQVDRGTGAMRPAR